MKPDSPPRVRQYAGPIRTPSFHAKRQTGRIQGVSRSLTEGEWVLKRINKIVLVEPRAPGYHVYSRVALPRLGLPQLAAIMKRDGYSDVTIYCEDIAPIDYDDVCRADFVGISTTTSTAMAAYRLGALVKRTNPKAVV